MIYDLAIVGSGLVGASLVHALVNSKNYADKKLKVVLLDKSAQTANHNIRENRGLALARASIEFLDKIKIWPLIKDNAYPIAAVHVSEQGSFGYSMIRENLGCVIDANILNSALQQKLEQHVTCYRPIDITKCEYNDNLGVWQIAGHLPLQTKESNIQSKFLIAADGTNSYLRQLQGITANVIVEKQTAIVTNLSCQKGHRNIAYERFTELGVLALLPFGDKKLKCVWTMPGCRQYNSQDFINMVQQKFGFRLGQLNIIDDNLNYYPIKQVFANQIIGNNLILLGNAANTLTPIAAQGFNLGLRDCKVLSELLERNLNQNELLSEYKNLRQRDHQNIINFTNNINTWFANNSKFAKVARRIGILVPQFVTKINKYVADLGMGYVS